MRLLQSDLWYLQHNPLLVLPCLVPLPKHVCVSRWLWGFWGNFSWECYRFHMWQSNTDTGFHLIIGALSLVSKVCLWRLGKQVSSVLQWRA